MSKRKYVHIGLLVALVICAALLLRGASLYVIPAFLIAYVALAFLNRRGENDSPFKEEDPADWWKEGKDKQRWDI